MFGNDSGSNDDRAGVDERYATAANARTLEVARHHGGPVDVLAAAAWSESRIGAQLLRLHSEFDAAERAEQGPYRNRDGKWIVPTDAMELRTKLRTLSVAVEQVTIYATKHALEDAHTKARHAVLWWLDHRCPKCQGRRWKTVKNTPHLSGQTCPSRDRGGCGGTGEVAIPNGQDGRKLAAFIEDCVSRARQSIAHRLHGRKG